MGGEPEIRELFFDSFCLSSAPLFLPLHITDGWRMASNVQHLKLQAQGLLSLIDSATTYEIRGRDISLRFSDSWKPTEASDGTAEPMLRLCSRFTPTPPQLCAFYISPIMRCMRLAPSLNVTTSTAPESRRRANSLIWAANCSTGIGAHPSFRVPIPWNIRICQHLGCTHFLTSAFGHTKRLST